MKKRISVISAVTAFALIVSLLLVFSGCSNDTSKESVQKMFLGGQLIENTSQQIFAKLSVNFPFKNTPYKSKVEGLPSNFELYENNVIYSTYYQTEYMVSPPEGSSGQYPYKILMTSDKEKFEFEGVLTVGKPSDSPDRVGGNVGKTGYLGATNISNFAITSKTEIGKLLMANPVVFPNVCVIGTSNGELVGVDFSGKILWRVQITKNIIDTLQQSGSLVIVSDNSGLISTFDIDKLSKGEDRAENTYRIPSTLSGPPTIIDKDMMVIGSTDGKVACLSLPDLRKIWEIDKIKGTVIGSISAVPLGEGKGNIYINSADKNTYILDYEGNLQKRLGHPVIPIGSPCASNDTFAVLSAKNQLQLRYSTGLEAWIDYCEFEVAGMPVITSDQIFVYGKNKLKSVSRKDGSELWTIDLPSNINANPVVIGDHIVIATENKNVNVIRANDGLISYSFSIDGSMVNWPYLYNDRLFIVDRRGSLFILSKPANGKSSKFDMSQVVTNGASTRPDHNNVVNTTLPLKPKLLWSLDGSFAPAITTKDKVYLYNIDKKEFSCHKMSNGNQIWNIQIEAAEGMFYGFSITPGAHETPMFFTEKGLLLGTKNGLVLVDPDTGSVLSRSNIQGIPQSDGNLLVCTTGKELTVATTDMKKLWSVKGEYLSPNVLIEGDFIYAVKRGEGAGRFDIFEAKTGKSIFDISDTLFDISAAKLISTKQYIVISTMQGPWVYDKMEAKVKGTSGTVSLTNIQIFECNYVNNKLVCSTNDFGLDFDLKTGEGTLYAPKIDENLIVINNGGHWMFTSTNYVCLGIIPPKEKVDINTETMMIFPKLLQIRNMNSDIVASVKIEANDCEKYGIALGGSTIILSEICDGAKLRVYGP
ncbi:MAG: PQQ-binding-like beta-propeller repeat protein [Caldisericia bacterium]|nr:PQQ-binding-like beta-propeller repeat protein [Caldisericia bacterium]